MTYSIIIPHKNIPRLLERCLASIPVRDDVEVIIVDDNSDPAIVDFDRFPGLNRHNTTVIFDKSGKGAGRARNIGLDHAKGKWLLFADADDFFNYCVNEVLDEYQDDEHDIVFFSVTSIDSDLYINDNRGDGHVFNINKFFKDGKEHFFRYHRGSPWSKIIKKTLVDCYNVRFQETTIHNDTRFSYITGHYANTIKVDRRAIYCITYRPQSITYTLSDEKIIDRARVMGERGRFFVNNNIDSDCLGVCYRDLFYLESKDSNSTFNECIDILEHYGFSREMILKNYSIFKKKKKKEEHRESINKKLAVFFSFTERAVQKCARIIGYV